MTIPDIELIQLSQLDNLPDIRLPNEKFAYAIRRFDRAKENGNLTRIHTEDFAQVFGSYSHEKYLHQNQEMIGAALYKYSANGLADIQQMARRLVANILIGNGDAHLKNWSLIYSDRMRPMLSPAYDIVATHVYMQNEHTLAFKMGRQNDWYQMTMGSFEIWSERIGVSWPAIKVHVVDAVEKARAHWPQLLNSLPMIDNHKAKMRNHWANLSDDFRI